MSNITSATTDRQIPAKRLQLDAASGILVASPKKELFLRGPIPLEWLSKASKLQGKVLHVAIALWWCHGMAKGKPFKLTQMALSSLNIKRGAVSAGLARLEQAGLIRIERNPGQRPTISIITAQEIP